LLDAAVIGGGPVGSRVAAQLAGTGYKVAVFEKRTSIGQKSCCTGIVSQECVRRFDIPDSVIIRKITGANLFSPSGASIRVFKPECNVSILNRSSFDLELATRAQAQGAVYHLNSQVEEVSLNTDRVLLKFSASADINEIEARVVVLTAGFNSHLLKFLGLGRIDYFVAGAQTEVEVNGLEEVEVYFDQDLAPGYFAWLVPTTNSKCLAGLMAFQSSGKRLRDWLGKLELNERIKQNKHHVRYGGIPLKPLAKTYADRLLVVGDAAGQVKPTTGGGIYFGLLSADIAAETLHKAFKDRDYSAGSLSLYQRKWRKKLGHELRVEYLARRFYERLKNDQIDGIFERIKSGSLLSSILREDNISFDWHGDLLWTGLKLGITSKVGRFLKLPRNLSR
jgi:digeranylgeranylglycerophospholipid reductase